MSRTIAIQDEPPRAGACDLNTAKTTGCRAVACICCKGCVQPQAWLKLRQHGCCCRQLSPPLLCMLRLG
jgi:hypothetical protein